MDVAVELIVNPSSGPASRRLSRASRRVFAVRTLEHAGAGRVRATETHSTHEGIEAARRAVADGVPRVVVWGGDGTVNAVAAALAGTQTALAIVPGGSGNGLARTIGVPLDIEPALRLAVTGSPRPMDLGVVDDRLFVNIAGVGLDAAIAHRYNSTAGTRRGLPAYVRACLAEVGKHATTHVQVRVDGVEWFAGPVALVAVANGRQYGHGARIAPDAALDDGLLDVVTVPDVTTTRACLHGWRLFTGTLARVPDVHVTRGQRVVVTPADDVLMHRDGEVEPATAPLRFAVRPRALLVIGPSG